MGAAAVAQAPGAGGAGAVVLAQQHDDDDGDGEPQQQAREVEQRRNVGRRVRERLVVRSVVVVTRCHPPSGLARRCSARGGPRMTKGQERAATGFRGQEKGWIF